MQKPPRWVLNLNSDPGERAVAGETPASTSCLLSLHNGCGASVMVLSEAFYVTAKQRKRQLGPARPAACSAGKGNGPPFWRVIIFGGFSRMEAALSASVDAGAAGVRRKAGRLRLKERAAFDLSVGPAWLLRATRRSLIFLSPLPAWLLSSPKEWI